MTGSLVATWAHAADGANGPNGNGAGASTIINQSPLGGGKGGDGAAGGSGGDGGIGALVTGGGLSTNVSAISGGAGGSGGFSVSGSGGAGGAGGAGGSFIGGGAIFMNSGAVAGGAGGGGGEGVFGGAGGAGGAGASFAADGVTFVNSGVVTGGEGGDGGGAFLFIPHVDPVGPGGDGGAGALFLASGAVFTNTGDVTGSAGGGGNSGGAGGAGAFFAASGATFTNSGAVTGGSGGSGNFGGAGASFAASGATFTNTGVVTGGVGGGVGGDFFGAGGAGVSFAAGGASFTNAGVVTGGTGGIGREGSVLFGFCLCGGVGSPGGSGVSFADSGSTFINSGRVSGGVGGPGGVGLGGPDGGGGPGGTGGAGALLTGNGTTFWNSGVVTGGAGGLGGHFFGAGGANGSGGAGGPGVVGAGVTIINGGTISGGLSADGGTRADAIDFTGGANVLELRAGSTIVGNVIGTGADLLRLGGAANSAFDVSELGRQYQGFSEFQKSGVSVWTLTGSTNALTPWVINQGALSVSADANLGAAAGGLTLNGGALQFAGNFDLSAARAVSLNVGGGTIDTNGFSTDILSTIGGIGSLTKVGAGTLTLSGAETYTGATNVDQGAMVVNGSIASSSLTTINGGGTLAGSGAVGNLLVAGGAVFAPGLIGRPGTMTVAGDLTFRPGSYYGVQIGATGASRANVSESALLDGTVVAAFAPGALLAHSYDILHADVGFGNTRFSGLNDLPNLLESLSYGPNDVFVDLTAATLGQGALLPGNQQSVASALNGYFNAGGVLPGNFARLYGLTGSALSNALASASGEAATGAQESAFQPMDLFIQAMLDPTAAGRSASANAITPGAELPTHKNALPVFAPGWISWATVFGGAGRIDGDPTGTGSHDLSANAFGVAAGLDYHLARDMFVGVALGGGQTSWALSQGFGGGAGDVFDVGVYGSRHFGAAYVSGALAFANQWLTTSRSGPFGETLSGNFVSQTYGGRIEGGYRVATQAVGLTPYAALEAMGFNQPSYRENDCCGGGFGLAYEDRTASDIRSEFGARFDDVVAVQPGATLTLRGRAAWVHDWVSNPTATATFETLPGASFNIVGAIPAKNAVLLSGDAELGLAGGATLGAKFDGELASSAHAYAGTVFLRLSW